MNIIININWQCPECGAAYILPTNLNSLTFGPLRIYKHCETELEPEPDQDDEDNLTCTGVLDLVLDFK